MYTALEQLREMNIQRFGISGPVVPNIAIDAVDITISAVEFVRDLCEKMHWNSQYEALTDFAGTSLKKNQIPYNMEMDLNRLCLEVAIQRFMRYGAYEDAFDLFYICAELFGTESVHGMLKAISDQYKNENTHFGNCDNIFSKKAFIFVSGLADYAKNEKLHVEYERVASLKGMFAAVDFLQNWSRKVLFEEELSDKRIGVMLTGIYDMNKDLPYPDCFKNIEGCLFEASLYHLYEVASLMSSSDDFGTKSLEYRLIDVQRVKRFLQYQDTIGCFYSDRETDAVLRETDAVLMEAFTDEDAAIMGPIEHEKWLSIHYVMGWEYDVRYKEITEPKSIREIVRMHCLMLENGEYTMKNAVKHYYKLPIDEQDKDTEPFNELIQKLLKQDGVKFYKILH